jgi:hypothetical protein
MAARAKAGESTLHKRKFAIANYFAERVLPQTMGLEESVTKGSSSVMALEAELF